MSRTLGYVALCTVSLGLAAASVLGAPDDRSAPAPNARPAFSLGNVPSTGYADLVERVNPAVVTVFVTGHAATQSFDTDDSQFQTPFDEFFRHFGIPNPGAPSGGDEPFRALGSGFVLDGDGYVVTNDHVIDHATSIKVRLNDESEFDAKVVGADSRTDLALLKIDAKKPLPHVELGDSDKARVGDAVIAVGNPFGLGDTVTSGIISARGRDLDTGPYVDYFQTDAAINRGNSGGPLFNVVGEVIGVNSAIFSPNGGSVGVGFAIPSNVVKTVTTQLKDHGTVARGWLGVTVQPVTSEIADATGAKGQKGALVAQVASDGPANGKLEPGDVIVRYDDRPVDNVRDLPKLVAATPAGRTVRVDVMRSGAAKTVKVQIAALKDDEVASTNDDSSHRGAENSNAKLEATVAPLTDIARQQLGLDANVRGVVITSVKRSGPAAEAGLRVGDVIVKIGSVEVKSAADVNKALASTTTPSALFFINRGGEQRFVGVRLS